MQTTQVGVRILFFSLFILFLLTTFHSSILLWRVTIFASFSIIRIPRSFLAAPAFSVPLFPLMRCLILLVIFVELGYPPAWLVCPVDLRGNWCVQVLVEEAPYKKICAGGQSATETAEITKEAREGVDLSHLNVIFLIKSQVDSGIDWILYVEIVRIKFLLLVGIVLDFLLLAELNQIVLELCCVRLDVDVDGLFDFLLYLKENTIINIGFDLFAKALEIEVVVFVYKR